MDCIFCGIIAGELPAYVIREDEYTVAFLDINPVNRGHCLVVPREHVESLHELPAALSGPLLAAVAGVSRLMSNALGCGGYNVFLNNGAVAGQLVPHVHFHLLPRWPDDGVSFHARQRPASTEELREVQRAVLDPRGTRGRGIDSRDG